MKFWLNKLLKVTELQSRGSRTKAGQSGSRAPLWSILHHSLVWTSLTGHHLTRKGIQPIFVVGMSIQQWFMMTRNRKVTLQPMRWSTTKDGSTKEYLPKVSGNQDHNLPKINTAQERLGPHQHQRVWSCQTSTNTRIIKGKPKSATWNWIKKLRKEMEFSSQGCVLWQGAWGSSGA